MRHIRIFFRSLAADPTYLAASIVTLALGLAGAVAAFSVVDGILLQPLPYAQPGQLVMVWNENRNLPLKRYPLSHPDFRDLREESTSFQDLAATIAFQWNAILEGGRQPSRVTVQFVSGSFFPMLGAEARLGRTLAPDDDRAEAPLAVLISNHLWRERFGSAQDVVGRTLALDGQSAEVVGVMPSGFRLFQEADLWAPLAHNPNTGRNRRFHRWLRVVGRLAPGVTLEAANSELKSIASALQSEHPGSNEGMGLWGAPLKEEVVGDSRLAILLLAGAVAMLLLIACANVSSLVSARVAGRRRELSVRRFLGAAPAVLGGRILAEGLVLGAAGGLFGLPLAYWAVRLLQAFGPSDLPRLDQVVIGWRTLAFALAGVVLASLLSALPAGLQVLRSDWIRPLRLRSSGEDRHHVRLRRWMVCAQLALALTLVTACGLFLQSLDRLFRADLGFQADHLLTLRTHLPPRQYDSDAKRLQFSKQLLDSVQALPGVQHAAVSRDLPLQGRGSTRLEVEGRLAAQGQEPEVDFRGVSPDYFKTMGIALQAGRSFSLPSLDPAREVVVNRTAARLLWKDEKVLGRRLRFAGSSPDSPWWQVVGVARDVRHRGAAEPAYPEVYFPLQTDPPAGPWLAVRSQLEPAAMAPFLRQTVRSLDPGVVVDDLGPMRAKISRDLAPYRFNTLLLAVFASLALLLALVGAYGVACQSVAGRRREIGLRTALGGTPARVVRSLLRRELRWAVLSLAAGLLLSLLLSRFLASLLFQVAPVDIPTYGAAALTLLSVSFLAHLIPALEGARADPVKALRGD